MGIARSRTLGAIALVALAVLALRRVERADEVAETLCAPARVLAELAAPVRWLFARSSAAADATLSSDMAAARALLADEQAFARPSAPALVQGRSLLHAEVVRRDPKVFDRLTVRYAHDSEPELGAPVVWGELFVGRVRRLGSARAAGSEVSGAPRLLAGEAEVELISAREFRVGCATLGPSGARAHFVAGGLVEQERRGNSPRILAISALEAPLVPGGEVLVAEDDGLALEPLRKLADGYKVGRLVAWEEHGLRGLGVAAPLDYRSGLQHVFVLGPPERASTGVQLAQDPFVPAEWTQARFAAPGNPSFWRATRTLLAGSSRGLVRGAALACGADFVGVLDGASRWGARVLLLGDPGLVLNVVARVEGVARPLPLGRLLSLSCDGSSSAVFAAWNSELGAGSAGARAVLYTAAGDPLVPPGLRLGTVTLPARGEGALRIERALDPRTLASARVWIGPVSTAASEQP